MILMLATGLAGCSTIGGWFGDREAETETLPVEAMYATAKEALDNRNYARAGRYYSRLVARFPFGPYAEQAQLELAYVQYKQSKTEEATSTIDRFIRTYPTHRNIPYMYYLRGLANSNRDTVFLQKVWRLDASRRDLATPNQAFNDFSIVVDRYPNSRYAEDARKRMNELRDLFARHELDVEHRDLDAVIDMLTLDGHHDQLQLRRLIIVILQRLISFA